MRPESLRWVQPIVAAVIVLGVLGFASLFFLAAYFEKRRLVPLVPAGDDSPPQRTGKAGLWITNAESIGFQHVAYVQSLEGWLKAYATLLLSDDQRVLAAIVHGRSARFKLMSKLANGRWLVTGLDFVVPDFGGIQIVAARSGRLDEVLAAHNRRLSELRIEVVPFTPDHVVDDLLALDQTCAQHLVATAQARWRDSTQTSWSYTIKSSIKLAIESMQGIREGVRMKQEAEKARGKPL